MKKLTNTFIQKGGRACFALLLSVLLMPMLFAQSVWTGNAGTTNWNTPGNWTGGVPAAGKTVIIYQCNTCPVINTTGNQAAFVQVYAGGKLTIGTGSLSISNPGGPGMKTQTNSQVNVSTGASLSIQNFWGEGLSVQGAFNNNGTTTINGGHTGVAVASGGAFANGPTGSLSISGSTLNYGLVVEGSFNNQNILSIDDANNDGIHVKTGTTLNLGGTVSITRTGVNGIYSRSTVNLSGNLTIDNALNGIYLLNATFNNSAAGKLTIGGSTFLNDGIYIDPGTFNNSGELTINQAISKGIEISSASTFNNFNKLTLNVPAWAGIFNVGGSNFTNKPCARIETNAPIVNYAIFTNNGIIRETSGGSSMIGVNNGTVQNLNGGSFSTSSGNMVLNDNVNAWTGCASTDWNNSKNWTAGTVPTAITPNSAIIQNVAQASGNAPVVSIPSSACVLTLDKNAALTVATGGALSVGTYEPYYFTFSINTGANLTIQGGGSLGATSTNLAGTIQNYGTLTVVAPFHSVGIFTMNGGTFFNNSGSQFTGQMGHMGSGSQVNLSNASKFTNNATVTIPGFGGFNLLQSSLTNSSTGSITMPSGGQIKNLNGSTVTNNGSIAIYRQSPEGIRCEGSTFNNGGSIVLSFTNILQYGGTFTNTGSISIASPSADGIINGGTFSSNGNLSVQQSDTHHGILNLAGASFSTGAGSISLFDHVSNGVINFGTFSNGGRLEVSNTNYARGIESQGNFVNQTTGNITIRNTINEGLANFNTFSNHGAITVENIPTQDGIVTTGTFENGVFGKITVKNVGEAGFWVFGGTCNNAGLMEIRNSKSTGFAAAGTFENKATGVLIIDQVPNYYGLQSWSTVKNYGAINISNCGNEGLAPLAHFENFATGVITIQQNQPSVWPGISNSLTFVNSGIINLQGNNQKSLTNNANATLTNRPCAVINHNGLIINNGAFSNQGLLTSTYAGTNSNPGTFTNTGVIEDFNNSFNGVPYTNNAFRIRPISGTVGSVIYNAVEAGGVPPITIGSTWYKDPNLTQSAGTFNSILNTFTPTLGVGTHTLYFTVKDIVNNCTKTVSVKVTITSALIGFGEKAKPDIVLFNYPNPFVDETRIKLSLPFDASGKLVIYDQFGRLVEVVYEGELAEGELYEFGFDASRLGVANYLATLVLDDGRSFTARLVKSDNW